MEPLRGFLYVEAVDLLCCVLFFTFIPVVLGVGEYRTVMFPLPLLSSRSYVLHGTGKPNTTSSLSSGKREGLLHTSILKGAKDYRAERVPRPAAFPSCEVLSTFQPLTLAFVFGIGLDSHD